METGNENYVLPDDTLLIDDLMIVSNGNVAVDLET